jgi:hypothetical protein
MRETGRNGVSQKYLPFAMADVRKLAPTNSRLAPWSCLDVGVMVFLNGGVEVYAGARVRLKVFNPSWLRLNLSKHLGIGEYGRQTEYACWIRTSHPWATSASAAPLVDTGVSGHTCYRTSWDRRYLGVRPCSLQHIASSIFDADSVRSNHGVIEMLPKPVAPRLQLISNLTKLVKWKWGGCSVQNLIFCIRISITSSK